MSALPAPQEANTAHAVLLMTGKVKVTRDGGGLGESVIGATSFVLSWNKTSLSCSTCQLNKVPAWNMPASASQIPRCGKK